MLRRELDSIERRVIEILQADGRTPIGALASAAGISEVTARRKLRRLLSDEVIKIIATVDPADVGYATNVLIGLKVEPSKIEEIALQVAALRGVAYVAATAGSVDLIVEVVVRSNEDLSRLLLEQVSRIDGVLGSESNLIMRIYNQSWNWGRDDADQDEDASSEGHEGAASPAQAQASAGRRRFGIGGRT